MKDPPSIRSLSILTGRERVTLRRTADHPSHLYPQEYQELLTPPVILLLEPHGRAQQCTEHRCVHAEDCWVMLGVSRSGKSGTGRSAVYTPYLPWWSSGMALLLPPSITRFTVGRCVRRCSFLHFLTVLTKRCELYGPAPSQHSPVKRVGERHPGAGKRNIDGRNV